MKHINIAIIFLLLISSNALAFPRGGGATTIVAPTITIPTSTLYAHYPVLKANGWVGKWINVTRNSDSTSLDIGFNASNYGDISAVTTFIGASTIKSLTWYDESGNGKDCVVNANNFSAKNPPIVRAANSYGTVNPISFVQTNGFVGATFCNLPVSDTFSSQSYSVFMAVSIGVGLYNSAGMFGLGNDISTAFNDLTIYQSNNPPGKISWTTKSNFPFTGTFPFSGVPITIGLRNSASASAMRINGTNSSQTASTLLTYTSGQIGSGSLTAATTFGGDIFDVAIYTSSISDVDAASIESAYVTAYNITLSPTDLIPMDGDSITAGYTGGIYLQNLERQVQPLLSKPVGIYNLGVNGQTMASIVANGAQTDAHYDAAKTKNIASVFACTNDIDGATSGSIVGVGTTCFNNIVTYVNARKVKGFNSVIVGTTLPRAWSGSGTDQSQKETERLTLNSLITTNAVADGYIVADYAALFPTASTYTNTGNGFSVDGIHPTAITFGPSYMSTVFANAVNPLL